MRPDQPFAWHDEGSERVDQRQASSGTTLSQQQALLLRHGDRLRGGRLLHGHRHQNGVIDFFLQVKVFRLQAMAIPLQATERCKHYT